MVANKIDPLQPELRWLREVQAPQQIKRIAADTPSFRVSSAAFKLGTDGTISGDLEESFQIAGLDITSRYPSLPRAVALVALSVSEVRETGMTVAHAPIPDNDHHAEVGPGTLSRRELERAARALADKCEAIDPINIAEAVRLTGGA